MNKFDLKRLAGYEEDFALWSAEQAALIRAGQFNRIDLESVAEEIESLGRSQRHAIRSRLAVLMTHLSKWERQPSERSRSWIATIRDQRREIWRLLQDSPSLKPFPGQVFNDEYPWAREKASDESTIFLHLFPATCPYTIEQILDPDFLPGEI